MDTAETKLTYEAWYELLRASLVDGTLKSPFGDTLPAFPGEELQRNTTSLAGAQALEQANGFYTDVSNVLDRSKQSIQRDWQILDFGACWGRISRFFMRDVALEHIHGVDVEPAFVDTCRGLFGSDNFTVCNALPPCDFGSSSFNVVTAYSVFSHLSESAFKAWLLDFHRMLVPGGIVAFTTRNETFFNYCKELQGNMGSLSGYQLALANMVPGIGNFAERYRAGDFMFATGSGVSGGGAMNESFYGEAFVPPAYIGRELKGFYETLESKPVGSKYDQALFVLKKLS